MEFFWKTILISRAPAALSLLLCGLIAMFTLSYLVALMVSIAAYRLTNPCTKDVLLDSHK